MGELASKRLFNTNERIESIRNAFGGDVDVVQVWEHEIHDMLKNNKRMKLKFENMLDISAIDPRAAFQGGRTGPLKLKHCAEKGKKIYYYDFTSLYPFVNYSTSYPIG